jgi:hypothetical protein
MYWIALLLLCLGSSCAATCVRDTDCLGTSVCEDNGCHLLVRGDAGRSSQTESPSSSQQDQPPEDTSDSGSSPASVDAGN